MKVAYVHNLPIEYYPPAENFLNSLSALANSTTDVYTTSNRKNREDYVCRSIRIHRSRSINPVAHPIWRFMVAIWWHFNTAFSLRMLRPDVVIYVEPHSAIAVYLFLRMLGGKSKLYIHHHELYSPDDYKKPGMRLPRLGSRLEQSYLFRRATWISQTNEDRLRMAIKEYKGDSLASWQLLPNYPPQRWVKNCMRSHNPMTSTPVRFIYVGSASFEDTYIEEIVRWVAAQSGEITLHICGYNIAEDIWAWLEQERFLNITFSRNGVSYFELPGLLISYDVGLVLYKGNTNNFIYNVPNKVFEYLACGLQVWYPSEMLSTRKFATQNPGWLREIQFTDLDEVTYGNHQIPPPRPAYSHQHTAESAFAPLINSLTVND
ncbi:hypothetical protein ACFL1C_00985 [Pseudomonadota bacterium]